MKTFLLFIVAIGRHYFALVTGGVIMGLVWLGRDVGQLNIPNWVNPFLAVLFLLVAGFLAWADERKKSEIAEQRAQTAEEKLNSVRLKVDVADLEARQNLVLADKKIQALTEELSKNRKQATPYNLGDNLTGDVEINYANGAAQFANFNGDVRLSISGGDVTNVLSLSVDWPSGGDLALLGIVAPNDAEKLSPIRFPADGSYILKLERIGDSWALMDLCGPLPGRTYKPPMQPSQFNLPVSRVDPSI